MTNATSVAKRREEHRCEWRDEAERMRTELGETRTKLDDVTAQLEAIKRKVFGKSSEKLPPMDRELRRGEKADPGETQRRRRANAELREKVVSEEVKSTVPEEQRRCPLCDNGGTIRTLGKGKECSVWSYVPGFFRRRRYVRETIACTCGRHVVTAPCPDKSTSSEKTRYAPSFVAHLVTSKCADAIPLYRLEKQYRRLGIPIARSTMNDLLHRNARVLSPLSDRLLALIAADPYVHADETPMKMISARKKAYVWTFVAGDLIGFRFSADRSGTTPSAVLGKSKGSLVVDGYSGYNDVTCPTGRVRAGCLAHARRKIFEGRAATPESADALALIKEIYRVEREAKQAGIVGTRKHLAMRKERSAPLMAQLRKWLDEQRPQHVPKSPMGRAVGYASDNWKALTRFLVDAKIAVDNNKAESALRRVALGRKNYLHVANETCGENIAGLYSLVATCEANDVNPVEYLSDVLLRVGEHPASRIDELLPHRWQRAVAA